MATTRVGASDAVSTNASSTTTVTRTRTAGAINNLIVISGYSSLRGSALTISDTQGNTWLTCNPDFDDATNGTRSQSWYCLAKNTSSTTITVTRGAGTGFTGMTLDEFTNPLGALVLDAVNHSAAGATGTNITGPAITMGADDCLVWSLLVDSVTAVGNIDGSAATKGGDDLAQDWSEFRVLTGRNGISVTAAWTDTGAYEYFIASFKPPASATRVPYQPQYGAAPVMAQ